MRPAATTASGGGPISSNFWSCSPSATRLTRYSTLSMGKTLTSPSISTRLPILESSANGPYLSPGEELVSYGLRVKKYRLRCLMWVTKELHAYRSSSCSCSSNQCPSAHGYQASLLNEPAMSSNSDS